MIVPFRLQAVICAGVHHQTDVLLASRPGRTQDFVTCEEARIEH